MPVGGVMILGHDFHSETAFAETLKHAAEVEFDPDGVARPRVPTWANLLPMLRDFGISPDRCFFTNAYMGLRVGAKTTGRFAGSRDPKFVARCQEFFLKQVEAQQPRVILALGAWVPRFLAPMADQLGDWGAARTFRQLDGLQPVRHHVQFTGVGLSSTSVACLTHPSLRGPNIRHRLFGRLTGAAAEAAMVQEALTRSGIASTLDLQP